MRKFYILFLAGLLCACTDNFDRINTNPNEPSLGVPAELFNFGVKRTVDRTRGSSFSGRMTMPWGQYWAPTSYTDEGLYQFRTGDNQSNWEYVYTSAMQFKRIIKLNTDPETKPGAAYYGGNEGQIAVSRVMLCYIFQLATDTWGDIPYYSYGDRNNLDFQALDPDNLTPKYASQEAIYKDLLKELKQAQDTLATVSDKTLTSGDLIYNGDATKWRKFANALRLRIANRIKRKDASLANQHIAEARQNTFASNADNAGLKYENFDRNAAPMYKYHFVLNRTDFALALPFARLLKGQGDRNPFPGITDPRLFKYAAPKTVKSTSEIKNKDYKEGTTADDYEGYIYGIGNPSTSMDGLKYSYPSYEALKADATEYLMTYAEVQFILSEQDGWSDAAYKEGIKASMEQWQVPQEKISEYLSRVPPAGEGNVITQKYIALYMQPQEAWAEYRRTGFPKILLRPGESFEGPDGKTYRFEPLKPIQDLPSRVSYPVSEQGLNGENRRAAVSKLSGGDKLDAKFWWLQ